MVERLSVDLPDDVVVEVDRIVELIGFERREEFVKAAIRRCIDHYRLITNGALGGAES